MTRKLLTILFTAALMLGLAQSSMAETVVIDRVIAIVGDDIITLSELQSEMATALSSIRERYRGDDLARETERLKRDTLNQLIDRSLQIMEAKKLGVTVPKEDLDAAVKDIIERNDMSEADFARALEGEGYTLNEYRRNLEAQLMIIRLINREVRSRVLVEEKDAKAFYEENRDKFTVPASVTIANIFFPADKGGMEAARQSAMDARKKMTEGTPFEQMAVQCTGDPDAEQNCVLGSFKKGELSGVIEDTAFSLAEGEISNPMKTEGGYQLIKVMHKTEAGSASYEEVKSSIYEKLSSKMGEAIYASWLKELRSRSYIEIRE